MMPYRLLSNFVSTIASHLKDSERITWDTVTPRLQSSALQAPKVKPAKKATG